MINKSFNFEIIAKNGSLARAGIIHTPHGDIKTPTFAVVGTQANVKCLNPDQLLEIGSQVILSNGYHLLRRAVMIDAVGGLAEYNGWRRPTMTDSGGFQVMSLGSGLGKIVSMDQKDVAIAERAARKSDRLATVDDEGVEFRDPWNGRIVKFTPEMSVRVQHQIGADTMMAFDELTNISDSYEYNIEALERTRRWAERSLSEHIRQTNLRADKPYQALFGVLQGAHYQDLREKAAHDLANMRINGAEFDGFGLGGAFEKERLGEIISYMTKILPENKPRHLLGLSKPGDIFVGVKNGCDTFDCVAPTREARHGRVYTPDGDYNLTNSIYQNDQAPLFVGCSCPVCSSGKTRAKIRKLIKNTNGGKTAQQAADDKATAQTLLSQHNVHFILELTRKIRASIINGDFGDFSDRWLKRYYSSAAKIS